ncbi:ABC transporter permease [Gorillibacterium sp. CAU 1737]|uniref:ABC transporter permease n=1 Tax=Gorillibacterium sp. CAU 1737 TaxID=3140362 RepID=UPI00326100C1
MNKYVANFRKYKPLLGNLILRDLKVKYRRSILGVLWSVLNPLLMMLVMTSIFSTLFKIDIPNFPVYYLTGSILFSFFSEATSAAMVSVVYSGPLIKKVYIPKYIFPVEKILFSFVNLLFSLVALVFIIVLTSTKVTWSVLLFPIPLLYALCFSLGLGLILSVLAVFFRDILHLYSVLLTAWTYFTPIFYPESIIPEKFRTVLTLNPLYHFINYFRDLVLHGTIPGISENLLCMSISVITLLIGLIVFKMNQDKFVLYV